MQAANAPTWSQAFAPLAPPARRSLPGARFRRVIRQSRKHGLWIAIWSIVGWIGTLLAPTLTDAPFVLMMLSPRALFVALASNSVPLLPFVLLGTLRLGVTDASHFIIGKRLPSHSNTAGEAVAPESVGFVRRTLRATARKGDALCRWFCLRPRLAGAFLFFRPNGKYLAIAGAYGVSAWTAGLSSAGGTAVFLATMHLGVGALF